MLTPEDFKLFPVDQSDMKSYIEKQCATELSEHHDIIGHDFLSRSEAADDLAESWMKEPTRVQEVQDWLINY